jgi:hypothetical protein
MFINYGNPPITPSVTGILERADLVVAICHKAWNSFKPYQIEPFNLHVFSPEDFSPTRIMSSRHNRRRKLV